ncbi:MAG: TetR/AcrR family transcriptional regulator [Syntrophorhabdales bacterium]|jgi:AcrR family transcriptional regulator
MHHKAAENIKDRIAEEAIGLFVRKSFKGTSIQDITDAVHVTKGAFYWHFKSKDALLDAIIDEYERVVVDRVIVELRQSHGNFIEKYRQFHKITTEFAYKHRDFCVGFMTLAAELTGSGASHEQKIIAIYTKLLHFLKSLIEQGKSEGTVGKDVDSEMTAHFVNAIQNGMLLEWYMFHKTIDGASLAKAYRQITVQGITGGV